MSDRRWLLASCFLLLFYSLFITNYSFSSAQTFVTANTATADFPNTIEFSLELDDSVQVQSAELIYDVDKFNCIAVDASVNVDPSDLSWTWQMIRSGNPPPGTEVSWYWEIETTDGGRLTTDMQTIQLADDRFDWREIQSDDGRITLFWYAGNDTGEILLESAESSLSRLENDMGIELVDDVELYIYGSSREMRDAVLYVQDWAGGLAYGEYNTILIGVEPSSVESWGVPTVAHELAHLVLAQAGRSCVGGSRPSWLEEGLAQVAEGEDSREDIQDAIETAIQDNSFAPLRSLNGSFPAHDSGARQAYAQAESVVRYLLQTYGSDAMQQLIATLANGTPYDDAVIEIYGRNLDQIDLDWRASIGADSREVLPTPTAITKASIPTIPPIQAPQDQPTPAVIAQPPAPSPQRLAPNPICGLGFLPLVFLVVYYPRFHRRSKIRT